MTLIELAAALVVLATLLGIAAPPLAELRDRIVLDQAVSGLRGALVETRSRSVGRGAALVLRRDPPTAEVVVAGVTERTVDLVGEHHDVSVDFGASDPRVIRFDALGIGRFASTSILFSVGDQVRRVVVSSWGRVRVE